MEKKDTKIERRFYELPVKIETRDGNTESRTVVGYAAVFDKWSNPMGGWFREKIDRNHYTKFNINGLLRGDSAARKEWYRTLFNIGVFTRNEIRALEEMNPILDGDKTYLQQNLAPAEMLADFMKMKYENQKKQVEPKQTKG